MPDLRSRVQEAFAGVRADLEALVRVPSVSNADFDQAHVAASAEHVARLLREAGLPEVQVLSVGRPDGTPG
ncbi:dipeptidase, partial [Cellulomonas hominis]|nr:dipeptidase [Cellulomonas hominis]